MRKRKRVKKPKDKKHLKIGDTVAIEVGRSKTILFGVIVAIQKDWKVVTLKFAHIPTQVYDIHISKIIPSNLYKPKHHAELLGVKP